jgi:hypothetical protein
MKPGKDKVNVAKAMPTPADKFGLTQPKRRGERSPTAAVVAAAKSVAEAIPTSKAKPSRILYWPVPSS